MTPWTAAHQVSLSITDSWSLLTLMSIAFVMPSNHLIFCRPLLLLPSLFPSIRVFSNESALPIVVPDVRLPEREERRPPKQWTWKKGEVYYWPEPGPSAASNAVVQVREPWAQAVTQIYRVSTCRWFKRIGYKFAKRFHWSKLLLGQDFRGSFHPIPNFLIGKQRSVLSES